MKWFLFLTLFLPIQVFAEVLSINQFSGLNTDDSPLTLLNGQTPDSENVVTDDGPGIHGREGFVLYSTESSRGLWSFPKSDGTKYLITLSGNNLKATVGSTFNIFIATVSDTATTVATPLGDRWYFANTVDGLKYWDGSSVFVASTAMKVSQLVTFKGRLAASGLSTSPRVIFLSKYLDGTNFTAPTNPADTDAAQITISGNLDEKVQALYATFQDKLVWFTPTSFGSIYGTRRSNFIQRTYSDFVGIAGPESVRDCDGKLRWLGQGRKVYEFDGATFYPITTNVDNLFSMISQGDSASRTNLQTTQSDWNAGTFDNTIYVDTETFAGSIQATFPDGFSELRDGTNGTKNVWTEYQSGTITGSVNTTGETLNIVCAGSQLGIQSIRTTNQLGNFSQGTTYHFNINSIPVDTSYLSRVYFTLRPTLPTSPASFHASAALTFAVLSTTTGRGYIDLLSITGRSGAGGMTTDFAIPAVIDVIFSSTNYDIKVDNVSKLSGTHSATTGPQYAGIGYQKGNAGSGTAVIDNFGVAPQTFTYTSQIISVGTAISRWAAVTINDSVSTNGASITYGFGSSASPSITSYNSIVSGGIPTVSTAVYAGFVATFTVTNSTAQARLDDFATNWLEGSNIALASTYYNQRYWLGVAISSTANNRVLVYDKATQWQRYSGINPAAMTIYGSLLYFGNSTGIFEAENGYSDNGTSITSYYKTSDRALSGVDYWSKLSKLYMTTENSGSTLSTNYYVNGTDTAYTMGDYVMSTLSGHQNFKLPFSTSEVQTAKILGVKWTIAGTSFWRIINANVYFDPIPLSD